jgi:pentose-5-phosphate-3-epimerase
MTIISPPTVGAVLTSRIRNVYLMITDSIDKIADYVKAGAEIITVYSVVEAR